MIAGADTPGGEHWTEAARAAPSLIPEALPPVTVPSFLKAGRRLAMASGLGRVRGNSSVLKMKGFPFF